MQGAVGDSGWHEAVVGWPPRRSLSVNHRAGGASPTPRNGPGRYGILCPWQKLLQGHGVQAHTARLPLTHRHLHRAQRSLDCHPWGSSWSPKASQRRADVPKALCPPSAECWFGGRRRPCSSPACGPHSLCGRREDAVAWIPMATGALDLSSVRLSDRRGGTTAWVPGSALSHPPAHPDRTLLGRSV